MVNLIGVSHQGRPVGEYLHNAKLTFAKVAELRRLRAQGWTYPEIGQHFGIHPTTAHRAATGQSWVTPVVAMLKSATQDDAQAIAKLAEQGHGFAYIARALNATGNSVLQVMKANCLHGHCRPIENSQKTECMRGHPLSGENLYVRPDGARGCKKCRRAASQRHKQRAKDQENAHRTDA